MAHPRCLRLRARWYDDRGWLHGYRHYENEVAAHLRADRALLDLGCGRTFPTAQRWRAHTQHVFGLDPAARTGASSAAAPIHTGDATAIPFPDERFDLVVCRSVLEHLDEPAPAFREIARVLRPGGRFIFLTPSRYDYVSVAAALIPNAWHAWILRRLENRAECDTFPTRYRANSRRAIHRLAGESGLLVRRLDYLNHHPEYLTFSPLLYTLMAGYDWVITHVDDLAFLRGWLLGTLEKPAGPAERPAQTSSTAPALSAAPALPTCAAPG